MITCGTEKVPILGLGPDWDQCPNMVPKKARFAYQVLKFTIVILVQIAI